MLKDITFGQFFAGNSFIHKIDPRAKILLLIAFIVLIFMAGNFASLGLGLLIVIVTILFSGIPARMYLKNLKVVVPIVIFTALLNIFYGDPNTLLLFNWWKINIYLGGIFRAVFMTVRVILLILISSVLTYTTTPNDLTDAIERLLKPFKWIGLGNAVHTMSMMMTIALRFIPTLIEETNKIMNAQKARGADIESGGRVKKVKALLPILIPLLISAVRRAYELAEAMECRCYNGGKGRQRMKKLYLSWRDIISFVFLALFIGGVIVSNFYISFGEI
jgi:energy-coupling factor transport system permease protein